LLARTLTTKYS